MSSNTENHFNVCKLEDSDKDFKLKATIPNKISFEINLSEMKMELPEGFKEAKELNKLLGETEESLTKKKWFINLNAELNLLLCPYCALMPSSIVFCHMIEHQLTEEEKLDLIKNSIGKHQQNIKCLIDYEAIEKISKNYSKRTEPEVKGESKDIPKFDMSCFSTQNESDEENDSN